MTAVNGGNASVDLSGLIQLDQGEISRRIFSDRELYEQELEQVFCRSWLFMAHESEIPSPGDYVTRLSGVDPVIVARTEDGGVRVFHNSCRHRGMQVCRVDKGNTSHFRCPYHGWTYKNDGQLIGVPAHKLAYGDSLDRGRLGLVEAPHVDTFHGLIFANWDPDAGSLDEYLGDIRWYLEILFARSTEGMEIVGAPQRSNVEMNWKLGADNFSGDGYHVAMTHRHALELGLIGAGTEMGHTIHTENGHTVRFQNFPAEVPIPRHLALPDEVLQSMEETLSPEQRDAIDRLIVMHGNVFPNFSFVDAIFTTTGDPDIPPVSFLNIRQWQPTSPGTTELWSWLAVAKESPDWWRDASRVTFIRTHGVTGTFDQDDLEIWTNITMANRGPLARRQTFNYEIGLRNPKPDEQWPGPGVAFAADYNEANQRAFYGQWLKAMESTPEEAVAP